jgi:YbgC/YbaW family acyl-CoA thioester hydrolase
MACELEIVVRSTEIDVNGHVNNAKYVEYLEWGREEWYDSRGFPYDRLQELGAATVTVNLDLNYRREANQGDALRVVTHPHRVGRTSFAFRQEIVRTSDGTVVADAVVTLVTIDPAARRARPLPEAFAAALRAEGAEG